MSSFTTCMPYSCKSSRKNNTYLQGTCHTLGTLHTFMSFLYFFQFLPVRRSRSSTLKMLWMRTRQVMSNLFCLRAFWHVTCEARASFEMKVCSTRDYREHRIMYKFNSQLQVRCLCKKLFKTEEARERKQWVNTERSSVKHPEHTGHVDK